MKVGIYNDSERIVNLLAPAIPPTPCKKLKQVWGMQEWLGNDLGDV